MNIEFKPTYLMIKRHSVTGLKYFCKTVSKKPYTYKGSGTFWKRHLKIHDSSYVETIWCELFTDKESLVEFATFFSEEFDIVNSKEWANLIVEDGLTGFLSENSKNIQEKRILEKTHHLLNGDIQRRYQLEASKNGYHNWSSGELQRKTQNELVKQGKHRFCDSNYQSEISKRNNSKRIHDGTHNAIQTYICPHCHKVGKGIAMFRHHFEKCKHKNAE